MPNVKLLNEKADYERLGINPDKIESWEDGRRNLDKGKNNWEWWYSDFIFDDGTTAVIQFFTKERTHKVNEDYPSIDFSIVLPDGKRYSDTLLIKAKDSSFSVDRCDNQLGSHFFKGDLNEYHIHVEPKNGFGADLKLVSKSKPYRPSTGYTTHLSFMIL